METLSAFPQQKKFQKFSLKLKILVPIISRNGRRRWRKDGEGTGDPGRLKRTPTVTTLNAHSPICLAYAQGVSIRK